MINRTDMNKHLLIMAFALASLTLAQGAKAEPADNAVSAFVSAEAIDLGLSVRWASCNLGAVDALDFGYYYAWGETTPKERYALPTYMLANAYTDDLEYPHLTKYCDKAKDGDNGFVDNKTVLEPGDDAATANWGEEWRMPTDAEWTELRENCTWTWEMQGSHSGYRVTSKTKGTSIFLPAAGYRIRTIFDAVGQTGHYWSSTVEENHCISAMEFRFTETFMRGSSAYRYCGLTVRPVQGGKTGTGITTTPQADDASATAARKVIRNGQVLIERAGKTYTITGVEVK